MAFYIVVKGEVEMFYTNNNDENVTIRTFREFETIGDYNITRGISFDYTCRAKSTVNVYALESVLFLCYIVPFLSPDDFDNIYKDTKRIMDILLKFDLLSNVSIEYVLQLINNFSQFHYKTDDSIIKSDEVDNHIIPFHIILKGSVKSMKTNGDTIDITMLGVGDYIGELAPELKPSKNISYKAETDVITLSITRQKFDSISRQYKCLNFKLKRRNNTNKNLELMPTESEDGTEYCVI